MWHRAEAEHVAHRHQLRVNGVDFDDVIYLRANMQHYLEFTSETHTRARTYSRFRVSGSISVVL